MVCVVAKGQQISRELLLAKLVDMLYERNDVALTRGRFRARGDVVEVYPATFDEEAIRVEFFGDEIDMITRFDPLTGHAAEMLDRFAFYPAKQFVTPHEKMQRALKAIREELDDRVTWFEAARQVSRSAADQDAHGVRPGDDAGDGFLQRDRELLAGILSGRPRRFASLHVARFFPKRLLADRGRVARHHPANRRDVRRGLFQKNGAG